MSKTIEISRELAESMVEAFEYECRDEWAKPLRELLAAPAVERQEPVALVLPERSSHEHSGCFLSEWQHGWNACLDKIKELNK